MGNSEVLLYSFYSLDTRRASGELHTPAVLPQKKVPDPRAGKDGLVQNFKFISVAIIVSRFLGYPEPSLITTPTELHRIFNATCTFRNRCNVAIQHLSQP